MQNIFLTTLVAVAIASDAFSVSLGIGTKTMPAQRVGKIAMTVGIFHIVMLLLGLYIGDYLAGYLEDLGEILGGLLLLFIGYRLIREALDEKERDTGIDFTRGTGLVIFAFSVSIDALTVGFTFGLAGAASILMAIVFGVVALLMTAAGLYTGQQLTGLLKGKGELLGGTLIILIGLYFIIF